ncbi:MAG: hypothetical protein ACXW32_16690 [Limisphaerales bacterium]
MDLGAIVDVAIGIIFVWIVLSLTTIQIQEWWTTEILDKRARDMEKAIHEMLANPNLKAQVYDHPVIRGLTAKKRRWPSIVPARFYNNPLVRGFTNEKRKIPSYIPSQQFALTLFDIAITAGTESSLIQQGLLKLRADLNSKNRFGRDYVAIDDLNILVDLARSAAATEAGQAVTNRTVEVLKAEIEKYSIKYPAYKDVLDAALLEASKRKEEIDILIKKQPKSEDAVLDNLKDGIAALSVISPEVNQTLNALLLNVEKFGAQSESNIAKARKNVEKWFDDSMDRVTGVFKRYSQWMALLIGFIIAFVLNVDSINLTLYLWRDTSVRQALAQSAANFEIPEEEFAQNPQQAMQDLRMKFIGLSLPVGWVVNDGRTAAIPAGSCELMPKEDQSFGMRLFRLCVAPPEADDTTNIWLKLGGIFLTALAARQGAPFWFDVLKRTVNLRGTGANPSEKEGK